MNAGLNAATPQVHAAVRASAGTGKTWLLVTRLVRLLLTGTAPDAILAITFTRKAAAEMQARLMERLFELTCGDDTRLDAVLDAMGIAADTAMRAATRRLYETLLAGDVQVNVTTFHAFCQSILRRFPLEAEVPPGFEVAEDTGLLEQAAWDALFEESTRVPDGPLADALETLFVHCAGLYGTQQVLNDFLQRRSDWWAYTQDAADPVGYAAARLRQDLALHEADPEEPLFTPQAVALLHEFHGLLLRHDNATHRDHAARLDTALDDKAPAARRLEDAWTAFFTQHGVPRTRKPSRPLAKSLGAAGQERFLELHGLLCTELTQVREAQRRRDTYALSAAWYAAGARLLQHYQTIKAERRVLDFADLEWNAYRLLGRAQHMHWVQYKLDQALEHVLIDEFQDTNPTQWQLIRPLLQELAAGGDRPRTAFLVGDEKQSIYRFRRAEPRLFEAAVEWLAALPDTAVQALDLSYRSAPAIVAFINRVFSSGPLGERLPHFPAHATHRHDSWGRVEVYPAVERPPPQAGDAPPGLRNPLELPRPPGAEAVHALEARAVAARIQALLRDTPIGLPPRRMACADIAILLRDRSHAAHYERALRDAGIPYWGISRGSLLDSLEVRDLLALLRILAVPYDALTLAMVLRSPLFDCSDADLMLLAAAGDTGTGPPGSWWERLMAMAADLPGDAPLARARRRLGAWREAAAALPVHDLLDRIYCEGEVVARYVAAFPPQLGGRVRANLARLIELALEVDSGRYPSLMRFLDVLDERRRGGDAPDEGAPQGVDAVSLLTIHAAKGLEWPVVFLADAAWTRTDRRSYHPLVVWPAAEDRPTQMFITGQQKDMDTVSAACYREEWQAQQREEANLLYVALTRAKQVLIISGCRPARAGDGAWLDMIAAPLAPDGLTEPWVLETGTAPPAPAPAARAAAPSDIDPRLCAPLQSESPAVAELNPSRSGDEEIAPGGGDAAAARRRGTAIHRMLDLLSSGRVGVAARPPPEAVEGAVNDPAAAAWWREACQVFTDPRLAPLFDTRCYTWAANEVPICYTQGTQQVYGIIDRLVVAADTVLLVDYKTHAQATAADAPALAAGYREAMQHYRRGVERLWPGRHVRALVLFTACAALIELPVDLPDEGCAVSQPRG